MVYEMRKIGIVVEAHHHEVATAGQSEIDMQFQPLLKMADQFMWYKYICKNVAKRHGKTVTFMPKPIFEDNGSGMHTHTSLWKDGKPLFAGDGYAGPERDGPVRRRRPAQARPGDSRVRRADDQLLPPAGARVRGAGQPGALGAQPLGRRSAFRCTRRARRPSGSSSAVPDPSCNGYLAWSAMLMAMLDGIQNKIDPGQAARSRHLRDDARRDEGAWASGRRPARCEEAINALEADHAFLMRGDVFTEDLIQTWIDWKRTKELDPIRLRPHPHEFYLYYDN